MGGYQGQPGPARVLTYDIGSGLVCVLMKVKFVRGGPRSAGLLPNAPCLDNIHVNPKIGHLPRVGITTRGQNAVVC